MATVQLAGLASNFDWKSFVDQIMEYERAPITSLEAEQARNLQKISAFDTLTSRFQSLQTTIADLQSPSLFQARTATLASSNGWSASASNGAVAGNYTISVSQLATASRLAGSADIGAGLASTDDVSGLTIATLPTATAVNAGVFTIDGRQVTVDLADSLQDVFDKIAAATDGAVTASYSAATDRVTLSGTGGEIILGAANDTSNFLGALRLANNGTDSISSSGSLGSLSTAQPLSASRLKDGITAVDGDGNGSFSINGVAIAYNIGTDSLSTVLQRINSSTAGVTASYDPAGDRISLVNKSTGDTGIFVSEDSGGLLSALGLAAGANLVRGTNALYTVNDGETLVSSSNILGPAGHGISGLSITATSTGVNTVTIASDTVSMRSKINAFVDAYNSVQTAIDEQTRITQDNGSVTAALLSDNREIQSIARNLRSQVFAAIEGLAGGISRLDNLGIDFSSTDGRLAIRDSDKLTAALGERPGDVAAFFTTASTGFAARLTTSLERILGVNGGSGYLAGQQALLTKSNTNIDAQIATIERQLEQRRALLESGFIAMETAQQKINTMQQQLTNAFSSSSSSS